jgi:hypothetical protein
LKERVFEDDNILCEQRPRSHANTWQQEPTRHPWKQPGTKITHQAPLRGEWGRTICSREHCHHHLSDVATTLHQNNEILLHAGWEKRILPSARYTGMVVILYGGYMLEFFGFRTMKK